MTIQLPTEKVKALSKSPKNLIIIGLPKIGKTELLAQLDGCLLLDLEDGSDFVDAVKMQARSVEEIAEIGQAIKDADYPYKYIAVDTLTALEKICKPYAEVLYSRTNMGKNWFKRDGEGKLAPSSGKAVYGDITNMPKGAGYQWVNKAFLKMLAMIEKMAPRIILIGHVKDTFLEKDGAELNLKELDLTGKLKRTVTSMSDGIGYIYRKSKNENYISFLPTDEIACGTRCSHLRNQEFLISKLVPTDKEGEEPVLETYWDKIFID